VTTSVREDIFFRGRRFVGAGVALTLPGEQEDEAHTRADGAIGDIEGRESKIRAVTSLDVKVNKIDDVSDAEAVDEVAYDPAADKAEGGLTQQSARIKMMAAEEQDHQRDDGHDSQQLVTAAEQTPGGTGVDPMNEFEKAVDDDSFLGVAEGTKNDLLG